MNRTRRIENDRRICFCLVVSFSSPPPPPQLPLPSLSPLAELRGIGHVRCVVRNVCQHFHL